MMKGYLTVFLSLSLSALIAFILVLTGNAVKNAEKLRVEGAADIGMNSVLGEFHIALRDRYELLYIDASYLGDDLSLENIESRLRYYINQNIEKDSRYGLWGNSRLEEVNVTEVITAAQGNGNAMKNQAVCYIKESKTEREEADITEYMEKISHLDKRDAAGEWGALQEQIAGMELPFVLNEQGIWEEVPLGNPADGIFTLLDSDILYLLEINTNDIGVGLISKNSYISGRQIQNTANVTEKQIDNMLFLTYLFEKMGYYGNVRENSFLDYQLEYIAKGKGSDYENLKSVAENIMRWRFAANTEYAFSNSDLYSGASAMAQELYAVRLKEEFKEPVTKSILYACAYLETIGDLRCLFSGGRIEVGKKYWNTGIDQVLSGNISTSVSSEGEGLAYGQYLGCILMLLLEDIRNLRSMDIMEMDIRYLSGNANFAMDWCVERFTADIHAAGSLGSKYSLDRTYGYY